MTFDELADIFDGAASELHDGFVKVAKDTGEAVEQRAKAKLGTYQPGWPQLQTNTMMRRFLRGYTPDDPLLMSGDLRASIQHTVDERRGRVDVFVGSNLIYARTQEQGRGAVPPRPYLVPATVESMTDVGRAVQTVFEKLLPGGR